MPDQSSTPDPMPEARERFLAYFAARRDAKLAEINAALKRNAVRQDKGAPVEAAVFIEQRDRLMSMELGVRAAAEKASTMAELEAALPEELR